MIVLLYWGIFFQKTSQVFYRCTTQDSSKKKSFIASETWEINLGIIHTHTGAKANESSGHRKPPESHLTSPKIHEFTKVLETNPEVK